MRGAILLLLAITSVAHGNFGSYSGGWGAELTGLRNVRIVSEQLTIDLRGCDGSEMGENEFRVRQPVGRVEAIYTLGNAGSAHEVWLVFASGLKIEESGLQVTLDDRQVHINHVTRERSDGRPLPRDTPGFNGGANCPFMTFDSANFSVRLTLPSGPSTLRVRFRTLIGNDRSTRPACCWQFVYLLSPARDWGGFDKLDVRVLLPAGWEAVTNLDVQPDGDTLSGSFDRLPADALTLTLRMPVGPIRERIESVTQLSKIGIIVFIPSALALARFILVRRSRTVGRPFRPWTFLLAVAVLWGTAAWWFTYAIVIFPFVAAPPLQRASSGAAIPLEDVAWFFAIVSAIGGTIATCLIGWSQLWPDRAKTVPTNTEI
jgi:hypothetical protein